MLQVKIEDPDKFEFASPVIKDSKTGISSHKRLLVVRSGHLYYYSNVPKYFDEDPSVLDYVHELPKSSVDVLNIKKIKTPSKNSPEFEVVFESRYVMERQQIRKTITNEGYIFLPKEGKQQTCWKFICENHYIKQKWIGILLTLIKYYQAQNLKMQSYFTNIAQSSALKSKRLSANKNPWKQKKRSNSDIHSMFDRNQNNNQLDDLFLPDRKPSSCKNHSNTFTDELKFNQYEMSQRQEKTIDTNFSLNMKKKPKQKIDF